MRRLSICATYIEEILRLGDQFEDMYPSLFFDLTNKLKLNFIDRNLLADLMKQYSLGYLIRNAQTTHTSL